MNVYNVIEDANGSSTVDSTHPFFHISQGTEDTAVVQKISDGHFVISFLEAADAIANGAAVSQYEALPIIVDPALLFGRDTTLSRPRGFFGKNNEDAFNRIINAPQVSNYMYKYMPWRGAWCASLLSRGFTIHTVGSNIHNKLFSNKHRYLV